MRRSWARVSERRGSLTQVEDDKREREGSQKPGMAQADPSNPNRDFPVTSPPTDSVSALAWSPTANVLAAASWDNNVRVWEVQASGQAVPRAMVAHTAPALCVAFHADGQHIFSGSCDQTALMYNVATQQKRVVAKHDAPVRTVHFIKETGLLLTGSWDRTLRYWDLRQAQPTAVVNVPERVYAVDVTHPLAVVACANRKVQIFDLNNPQRCFRELDSPLKMQTRCVANFPDKSGFAIASIEGRCAIQMVSPQQKNSNFSFKCHRNNETREVYAVNGISFHPSGVFATAGSDGHFVFWNKDTKQRLAQFKRLNNSITAASFNHNGSIFAYASGYDWSRGAAEFNQHRSVNVLLHAVQQKELYPPQTARRR